MFFKNEKEKCFAYLAHTACDKHNFILDFHITPGNTHDSVDFSDLYDKLKFNITRPISAIAVDAGYITPYIWKSTSILSRRTPILCNIMDNLLNYIKMVPYIVIKGTICQQTEAMKIS